MTEIKALPTIIMVLITAGLLFGIGLLTFDKFSEVARTEIQVSDENITLSATGTWNLANTWIKASTISVENGTDGTAIASTEWNLSRIDGVLTFRTDAYNGTNGTITMINTTYKYGASNNPQTAIDAVSGGLDDLAAWFAVFVVVIAASIVLVLVTRSFGSP